MIPLLLIATTFIVVGKALIFSYLAGRARGYLLGWEANSDWQRSISEHGLLADEVMPLRRLNRDA